MKKQRKILSIISKNKDLSDFEKSVYTAVLKIPSGRVRSYKWVAETIGRPGAARAIGNALNKNPYPVVVPCHRVIKSDGSIGGFAIGLKAKRRLLTKEGVDLSTSSRSS
ncbi:MAG: MGMT family protein [Candidatus Omnitrophota bacterium]